jgi:hypothetical protein
MRNDKIYKRTICNNDVWVVVNRPLFYDEKTKTYTESVQFCVAFRIGIEPVFIDGEYLKEGNQLHWFRSEDDAVEAAFQMAQKRIEAK